MKRVKLYDRLPEIYKIKDEEQNPPGQLKNYLALVENIFDKIHENIESLYHDLFIETCNDWVIPYIGDLLGSSHLSGTPWTIRADVADTIALRRRKGTLSAIEQLTYDLTEWGVHCVELRENLLWNQNLNHQRLSDNSLQLDNSNVVSRRTVAIHDPAMLSLIGTPLDRFAYTPDFKLPLWGSMRYNLPNLAIFLWRLKAYQIQISKPIVEGSKNETASKGEAKRIARVTVHPMGEPVILFNTHRFELNKDESSIQINSLTQVDETPNQILKARLNKDSPAGNPYEYISVDTYDEKDPTLKSLNISDTGIELYLPQSVFTKETWSIRGENLCAWELGLRKNLKNREIALDPTIGRMLIGVDTDAELNALLANLLLTYTYGAVGPIGAHPVSRSFSQDDSNVTIVNFHLDKDGLKKALDKINESDTSPLIIEINDNMVHELDISTVKDVIDEDGSSLQLNRSLIIRAADNQRPIIKLAKPLRFRPKTVKGKDEKEISDITVHLEGLYLTRNKKSFPAGEPLISRAALGHLEIISCTLDPGGSKFDGSRNQIYPSIKIQKPYGFKNKEEENAFTTIPQITIQNSIVGPLYVDTWHRLDLKDSIVDAGSGVGEDTKKYAITGNDIDPANSWGPETNVEGVTIFGRMRVESISGRGGIWVHALEALNNQKGCIKLSYFSGEGDDRLPQNYGCVKGTQAKLEFVNEIFGQPAYGQLAFSTDCRILQEGPNNEAMGACGFLLENHKWRNIQIRFREFMPVGLRPILIPVT